MSDKNRKVGESLKKGDAVYESKPLKGIQWVMLPVAIALAFDKYLEKQEAKGNKSLLFRIVCWVWRGG